VKIAEKSNFHCMTVLPQTQTGTRKQKEGDILLLKSAAGLFKKEKIWSAN
jgi:hypothetical protein